jgi:copper chaperone CopZ
MNNRYELTIEGMHCGSCVRRVREALIGLGAEDVVVELGRAEASALSAEELADAVTALGFEVVSTTRRDVS